MEILIDIVNTHGYTPRRYVRAVRESGGLGDVTRCLAVLQGLRIKYPDARIHFYGPTYLSQLIVPRTNIIDTYIRCHQGQRPRDAELSEKVYKHLDRHIKYEDSCDMWCPAYLHEPAVHGVVAQERTELWCQAADVKVTRPHLHPTKNDLAVMRNLRSRHDRIVGVQLGATCRSREWPFKYWNELFKYFKNEGIHVILFDVCYRWQEDIDVENVELVINGSWPDVVGRILATDLMITPDSGFYHLSGTLRKKTLGIFGPTSGQIISRIWNLEENTHHYMQIDHDDIDRSRLPKGQDKQSKPCIPICYQRWERGWNSNTYRGEGKYCAIIEQIFPDMVFSKAMDLMNDPNNNTGDLEYEANKHNISLSVPTSMKNRVKKWRELKI